MSSDIKTLFKDMLEKPETLKEGLLFDEIHWIRQINNECLLFLSETGESLQRKINRLHKLIAELKTEKTKHRMEYRSFLCLFRKHYKLRMDFEKKLQDKEYEGFAMWEGSLVHSVNNFILPWERDVKKEIRRLEGKLEQIEKIDEEISLRSKALIEDEDYSTKLFDQNKLRSIDISEWMEDYEEDERLIRKAGNLINSCNELETRTPSLEEKIRKWEKGLAKEIGERKVYMTVENIFNTWHSDFELPKRLKNLGFENYQLKKKTKGMEDSFKTKKADFELQLQELHNKQIKEEERYKLLQNENEKSRAEFAQRNEEILNQTKALLSHRDQEIEKLKHYLEQVEDRFEERITKKNLKIEELERGLKEGSAAVHEVFNKIQEFKGEDLKVKEEHGLEIKRDNTKETSSLGERAVENNSGNSEASNSMKGNYLTKEALDETLKTVQSRFSEEIQWNEQPDPKLGELDLNLGNESRGVEKKSKKKESSRNRKRNIDDLLENSDSNVEIKATSKAKPSRRNSKKEKEKENVVVVSEGLSSKGPDKSELIEEDQVMKKIKQD